MSVVFLNTPVLFGGEKKNSLCLQKEHLNSGFLWESVLLHLWAEFECFTAWRWAPDVCHITIHHASWVENEVLLWEGRAVMRMWWIQKIRRNTSFQSRMRFYSSPRWNALLMGNSSSSSWQRRASVTLKCHQLICFTLRKNTVDFLINLLFHQIFIILLSKSHMRRREIES